MAQTLEEQEQAVGAEDGPTQSSSGRHLQETLSEGGEYINNRGQCMVLLTDLEQCIASSYWYRLVSLIGLMVLIIHWVLYLEYQDLRDLFKIFTFACDIENVIGNEEVD